MREFSDHFEEEYLYLADVSHDAALISWGKFFFNSKMKLVEDKKIHMLEGQHDRHASIGSHCESYGRVTVEVLDGAGAIVRSVETDKTFAWVSGLSPNTQYTYRVFVPEPGGGRRLWGDGHLFSYDKSAKELVETTKRYTCRFRTFPDPAAHESFTFAVIGDTGTGENVQESVARALEEAVAARDVRLVIMLGDTVYADSGGSGDQDFEWLTTYFQPYRTIIEGIPFFPCMGNHDTDEGGIFNPEKQEDRLTLYDNLLVTPRFVSERPASRDASISPGLFYRFRVGADVEFICVDTSREKSVTSLRLFEFNHHKAWLTNALTTPLGAPVWRIPFTHHPPFCKGPRHDEDETRLRHDVIPQCEANGIRAFLSGHEHNFQCLDSPHPQRPVRCFVSGGAGGFRDEEPKKATDAFMKAWGGHDRGHFLIVTVRGNELTIEPIGADGKPLPLFDVQSKPLDLEAIKVGG